MVSPRDVLTVLVQGSLRDQQVDGNSHAHAPSALGNLSRLSPTGGYFAEHTLLGDTFLSVLWGLPRLLSAPSTTVQRAGVSCAQMLGLRGGHVLKSQDNSPRSAVLHAPRSGLVPLLGGRWGAVWGRVKRGSGPHSSQRLPRRAPKPSGRRACSGMAAPLHSQRTIQAGIWGTYQCVAHGSGGAFSLFKELTLRDPGCAPMATGFPIGHGFLGGGVGKHLGLRLGSAG